MRLIESKAKLLLQPEGLEGIYKQIEIAARTCYKSEDKITEDSAQSFVSRLIKSAHTAMLEHGTVYLYIPQVDDYSIFEKYKQNKYSHTFEVLLLEPRGLYVTTNLRVLQENNWLDDLQYLCDPSEFHEKRYTFRLTTSIGVTREIIRHRHFSFAEQSTRYCNFSKNKFGNEITFCIPSWWDTCEEDANGFYGCILAGATPKEEAKQYVEYISGLKAAEITYMTLINKYNWQPQQAREVLPLSTASEIVVTGFASDWKHFFDLRYYGGTGKPHPDMELLASKARNEFIEAGLWDEIMSPSRSNK